MVGGRAAGARTVLNSCSGWQMSVGDFQGRPKKTRLPARRQERHTEDAWNMPCAQPECTRALPER